MLTVLGMPRSRLSRPFNRFSQLAQSSRKWRLEQCAVRCVCITMIAPSNCYVFLILDMHFSMPQVIGCYRVLLRASRQVFEGAKLLYKVSFATLDDRQRMVFVVPSPECDAPRLTSACAAASAALTYTSLIHVWAFCTSQASRYQSTVGCVISWAISYMCFFCRSLQPSLASHQRIREDSCVNSNKHDADEIHKVIIQWQTTQQTPLVPHWAQEHCTAVGTHVVNP